MPPLTKENILPYENVFNRKKILDQRREGSTFRGRLTFPENALR